MEPFTALSLAACIAQFLEFGGKLIKETREIAKSGSSDDVESLLTRTNDLMDITKSLELSPEPTITGTSKEEQVNLPTVVLILKRGLTYGDSGAA